MEKWCLHFVSAVFDWILFILTGNDDIHKSLHEFEIRPDPTTDHGVTYRLASKNLMLPLFLSFYLSDPF